MTAPRQQPHVLQAPEQAKTDVRRAGGPVTFSDDELLRRRLERRAAERRGRERRGAVRPSAQDDLGTRELCHDLRQPLASSVVLAHMLEKETGLTAGGRQRLELLHAELGRLAGMLTSHLEPSPPVLVDLVAVVRAVCDAPVDGTAAPVELVAEQTPLVLGDPVHLCRMVANLVTNARSAAGPAGAVRVHVGSTGDRASIAVEDSGAAVGDAATSGYGLGLMIVDSVLSRVAGASMCTAGTLGGLRVTVTIPAALPAQDVGGHA